jgi:hypothetical protein
VVATAAICCHTLEGSHHIVYRPKIDIVVCHLVTSGDYKGAHASTVEVVDIATTRVALGGDGKKEGGSGFDKSTAVGKEALYVGIWLRHARLAAFHDIAYF